MISDFYLFLPAKNNSGTELNSAELSWVFEKESGLSLSRGSINDFVTASLGKHITVILQGEDILFSNVNIPGKNIQKILQAVPYVLEDNVVDDVDNLYFAIKKSNSDLLDNQYDVATISREYFEGLVEQLEKAGIYADTITADYLMLDNTLFFDGERVAYNYSNLKFSAPVEIAVTLVKDSLTDEDNLKVVVCERNLGSSENNKLNDLVLMSKLEQEYCQEQTELCLINNCSNDNVINLLQGEHKKKKDWSKTGKKWLPVAILFLIWLLVEAGVFVSDYLRVTSENEKLNTEIINIYKKTFPKSRRIIDAKAQMQQKLAALKKRKGQSGRSFTEMLSNSARVFAATKGLEIQSLRYYDGRINLEIKIASLQALDKMKEQLSKENGYQVEIQNASSGKENVTARIQITGAKL